MTDPTYPITVHLTEKQMDGHGDTTYIHGNADHALYLAIEAQRPRPIAVGDRVTINGRRLNVALEVKAIEEHRAWLWADDGPWGSRHLSGLTRVDDEAQSEDNTSNERFGFGQ